MFVGVYAIESTQLASRVVSECVRYPTKPSVNTVIDARHENAKDPIAVVSLVAFANR